MDRALYLAMTGAVHNTRAQSLHANNLANVTTSGFKADFAQARAMSVFGNGEASRAYALTERPATDFAVGVLDATGRSLDAAVQGEGFFAVQSGDGSEAYTRAGAFELDVDGMLRTATGLPVLGDSGPVVLPPSESVVIGTDGTISVRPVGQAPDTLVQVGRLKLVKPGDGQAMEKSTDGLFRVRQEPAVAGAGAAAEADTLAADDTVRIGSGVLETSNVNAVAEMVSILSLSRQFELQVKLMRTVEQDHEAAARILQSS